MAIVEPFDELEESSSRKSKSMATTPPPPFAAPIFGHLVADPALVIPFLDNALHVLGAIAILLIGF